MTVSKKGLARRTFLRNAMTAAGTVAAIPAMQGLSFIGSHGRVSAAKGFGGYGPLVPTPDLRDGVKRIALPEGFTYRTFSVAGTLMSDGNKVPLAHDGMGVFNMPDGKFRLVRNHEDRNSAGNGTTALDAGLSYDMQGWRRTTTLVVNPFTRELERDLVSLSGTTVNCAGGVTPWESWITCEETNVGPTPTTWLKQHGYCFDVPAAAERQVAGGADPGHGPLRARSGGCRPGDGIVYETEDNGNNSGFYRFIPNTPGVLSGGKTRDARCRGRQRLQHGHRTDCRRAAGRRNGCDSPIPTLPARARPRSSIRASRSAAPALARLEGCWYGNGAIYFASTSGGDAGGGQVWEFRPEGDERRADADLRVTGESELDSPDNLTVSPQGALLLCEDGGGDQFMRGVTLDGRIFDFAENIQNDFEWAGATFAVADPAWNDQEDPRRQSPGRESLGPRHAVREPPGFDERRLIRPRPATRD